MYTFRIFHFFYIYYMWQRWMLNFWTIKKKISMNHFNNSNSKHSNIITYHMKYKKKGKHCVLFWFTWKYMRRSKIPYLTWKKLDYTKFDINFCETCSRLKYMHFWVTYYDSSTFYLIERISYINRVTHLRMVFFAN